MIGLLYIMLAGECVSDNKWQFYLYCSLCFITFVWECWKFQLPANNFVFQRVVQVGGGSPPPLPMPVSSTSPVVEECTHNNPVSMI